MVWGLSEHGGGEVNMPAPDVLSTDFSLPESLARLERLQPLLESNGVKGEADRRVVDESITTLGDAGAFKIAQPRRNGGYETPVHAMLDVSAAVAEADGGTAWVVALFNISAWLVGLVEQHARDDVWAAN